MSIISPKNLEDKPRGYSETTTSRDNLVTFLGWNDDRAVYVASNCLGATLRIK